METLMLILEHAPRALEAALAILGGLKLFARYTKSEADDKIIAKIESAVLLASNLAKKLRPAPKEEEPKDEEK
jgi:hypothetical protein